PLHARRGRRRHPDHHQGCRERPRGPCRPRGLLLHPCLLRAHGLLPARLRPRACRVRRRRAFRGLPFCLLPELLLGFVSFLVDAGGRERESVCVCALGVSAKA
ncbi:unnamed protein product, partial [Ectocarpus sp. 12 AP-2014]